MYICGHLYEVIKLYLQIRFPASRYQGYVCLSHEAHLLGVLPLICHNNVIYVSVISQRFYSCQKQYLG